MIKAEVAIIGAGPGGLAAAQALAGNRSVALIDMQAEPGGQIWRGAGRKGEEGITWLPKTTVLDAEGDRLLLDRDGRGEVLQWKHLILACGARDLSLPFPGWILPGVFTVGGLQAMIKSGYDVAGKRLAITGTGPLLFALMETAQAHGAEVVMLADQTPKRQTVRFGKAAAMLKPARAARLALAITQVQATRCEVWTRAIRQGDDELILDLCGEEIRCDLAAVSYGLVPNLELAQLLGCETGGGVNVNERLETSRPNVYALGEQIGIGGQDAAWWEGRFLGSLLAGKMNSHAQKLMFRHGRIRGFIDECFRLDPLLIEETQAFTGSWCRCEKTALNGLPEGSFAEAKLQTRVGMGPCQGKVCGAAAEAAFGAQVGSPRPPLFPTELRVYQEALEQL